MSDSIREGLEDAIAYAKGDTARGRASDIPVERSGPHTAQGDG